MQGLDADARGLAREIAFIAATVVVAIVLALAAPAYAQACDAASTVSAGGRVILLECSTLRPALPASPIDN